MRNLQLAREDAGWLPVTLLTSPQRARKMLISVAAIACSLLVRPPAVPLYRTPTPARLSSPQMATEELVEQFVDWVRLSKPCSPHVCPGHH